MATLSGPAVSAPPKSVLGRRRVLELASQLFVLLAALLLILRIVAPGSLVVAATVLGLTSKMAPTPVGVEPPLPSEPVSLVGLWTRGGDSASIGIMVFEDFECPACARFERETAPQIVQRYVERGDVKLAYWPFPLPQHSRGMLAAVAAECAGREGKFWDMHAALYSDVAVLQEVGFLGLSRRLNLRNFDSCSGDEVVRQHISKQKAAATSIPVQATPTVLLGTIVGQEWLRVTRRWTGTPSHAALSEAVEALLKRTDGRK